MCINVDAVEIECLLRICVNIWFHFPFRSEHTMSFLKLFGESRMDSSCLTVYYCLNLKLFNSLLSYSFQKLIVKMSTEHSFFKRRGLRTTGILMGWTIFVPSLILLLLTIPDVKLDYNIGNVFEYQMTFQMTSLIGKWFLFLWFAVSFFYFSYSKFKFKWIYTFLLFSCELLGNHQLSLWCDFCK